MPPGNPSPLTIDLRGTWPTFTRRYFTPTFGEIPTTPLTLTIPPALATLHTLLSRGALADLDRHLTGASLDDFGALLFATLLGDEGTWAPVLRRVFGQPKPAPQPNPTRAPVRVRIRTNDPRLQALPWRACMWQGLLLVDEGWTFEIDLAEGAARPAELRSPGSILVIAPSYPGMAPIHTGAHLNALADAFEHLSPGRGSSPHFEVARTAAEVRAKLAGMAPDIVYFYGHGDAQGDQLRLLLGSAGPEPVLMRDLAAWLAEHPPRLAFFNGCHTGQAGWHAAGWQLGRRVPVVVTNATSAWSDAAGAFAVFWFAKWLGEGLDPVAALHSRALRAHTGGFAWITPIVHTSCSAFTTHRQEHGGGAVLPGPPEDWLDRNEQRARGSYDVLELVDDRHRRVMAAATCAPAGNHLERIGRQIVNRILRHAAPRVRVRHQPLRFPPQRGAALAANLEEALKLQLGHNPADALEHVLAKQARSCPPGSVMVLWADWGVFGGGPDQQAKLSSDDLRAFVAFARDRLAPACNEERLRVVTSVAIEQVADRIPALDRTLQGLAAALENRTPRFVFKVVPPLKDVELVEIVEYLEQVGCDHGIAHALARAIHERTRGRYEETVALLKRGLASSWYLLKEELAPAGEAPSDDGLG